MSLGFRYPLRMCSNSRGHCRFTGHWFIRRVRPLFIASPNFTALNMGPYPPITETVPPLRTESIAQLSAIGDLLHVHDDVVVRGEVVRLGVCEAACRLEPVVQVIDNDDPSSTHEPSRLCRKQTDWAGTEDRYHVTFGDVTQLSTEVAGGQRVGEEDSVLIVHPLRNQTGSDVGERHPHVLGLPTVVATAGV